MKEKSFDGLTFRNEPLSCLIDFTRCVNICALITQERNSYFMLKDNPTSVIFFIWVNPFFTSEHFNGKAVMFT